MADTEIDYNLKNLHKYLNEEIVVAVTISNLKSFIRCRRDQVADVRKQAIHTAIDSVSVENIDSITAEMIKAQIMSFDQLQTKQFKLC